MARVTRPADHCSLAEVDQRCQAARSPWHRRAWDVIDTALADPRPAAVIAVQPGVSVAFVHRVTSRYRRLGPDPFRGGGRGGRRHASLMPADETAFVAALGAEAAQGALGCAPCLSSPPAADLWRNPVSERYWPGVRAGRQGAGLASGREGVIRPFLGGRPLHGAGCRVGSDVLLAVALSGEAQKGRRSFGGGLLPAIVLRYQRVS